MQNIREEIKKHKFFERWQNLENSWSTQFGNAFDAILVKDGSEDENAVKIKTLAIQMWLLKFEFINSIIIIGKKKFIFFASEDKIDVLRHFESEAKQHDKEIILIERNEKIKDQNIEALFMEIKKTGFKKCGVFSSEKQIGKLIELFEERSKKEGLVEVDFRQPFQEFLSKKDDDDIKIMKKCAKANCQLFQKFISTIENIVEDEKREKHSDISKKMEGILVQAKKSLYSEIGVNPEFFDYAYSPVIQSGTAFDLKPNADSNSDIMQYDCILLNLACKYFEMNTNVFRTLLIDPKDSDTVNYRALLDIHKKVISLIEVGTALNLIYKTTLEFCQKQFPNLATKLPTNFGFGIGYEFRESCLLINSKNEKKIDKGNIFTIITSLNEIHGLRDQIYSMHIADTVLINLEGEVENLTSKVPSKLEDVVYFIQDNPATKKETKKDTHQKERASSKNEPIRDGQGKLTTRAARRKAQLKEEQNANSRMNEHQQQLLNKKMEELEERLKNGNFTYTASESAKIILEKLTTYTPENFPKGLDSKQVHVDAKQSAILLPINGQLLPMHISCLKNVTKHQENKISTLRFNFQTPGVSTGNIIFPTSSSFGCQPMYLKELSFKSNNVEAVNAVLKQIKDVQKNLKSGPKTSTKNEKDKPVLKNKLKTLNDLKMRPTMTGRKTSGSLTAFSNGFKFVSKRNENFEFSLNLVKHAIFQMCDENMIIILHFYFHEPIEVNKKLSQHVQFYSEVGYTSEDLHDPKRHGRNDIDEQEEEELEEQAREHYNKMFLDFVTYVENHWESSLKFDSPFKEKGFNGSPGYSNVFLMPAVFCLVSLMEPPFLVISLDEIEIASIERVDNKIKNFDLIFIFKDFTKPVQSITNIPKQNLEGIKEWLDNENILFMEGGTLNLKWDNLLKRIRSDPEKFVYEDKGWRGFFDEDENEQDEDNEDSEFNEEEVDDDEEGGEGDESEFDEDELVDEDDDEDFDNDLDDDEDGEVDDDEDASLEESESDKPKKKKVNPKK